MTPSGWREANIGDVCRVETGGTPSRSNPAYWNGNIPWMASGEIHQRRVRETAEFITEAGLNGSNAKWLPSGTVMLAMNGQGKTRGSVALLEEPMTCNQSLAGLITNPDLLMPDFLFHWLDSQYKEIRNLTGDEGRNGLNLNLIRGLELLLPPLPEQQKIAAILGSVDDAIQATQAVIEQTRKVKQGLLQQLLTRGIGHTRFKLTEIGEFPESWTWVPLEAVADVERGKFSARPRNDPQFYGGEYPFVQTGDVTRSNGKLRSYSQTLNNQGLAVSRLFPKGTILITIAANIGDVALTEFDVACPDSLVGVMPKEECDAGWLLYYLQLQKGYLDSKATQNAQKNINLQVLRPMLIALPPLKEQIEIRSALDSLASACSLAEEDLENLWHLKAGLMADLLTGRRRVEVSA